MSNITRIKNTNNNDGCKETYRCLQRLTNEIQFRFSESSRIA